MAKFGFIGTGNMGGALAKAARKRLSGEEVLLANRTAAKAEALETLWGYGGEEARGWWQARHDSLTELFCSD